MQKFAFSHFDSQDLSANPAFLRRASEASLINFGCVDVSGVPLDKLANYVIDALRADDDTDGAGEEELARAQRIVLKK